MRKKVRNAAHFVLLVLITAFILVVANLVFFAGLFARWREDIPFGSETVLDNLTLENGGYSLSEEGRAALEKAGLFAMIISEEGEILWEERLPAELEKRYTMQDVARFVRYYLDGYPVHTYVIPEGLLIIGSGRNTTWKYTLEYNMKAVSLSLKQMPVLLLANIALLAAVPLFIQRKWIRRREEERTEWIAGISHDIRTPLTLILGNAAYIGECSDDPAAAEKAAIIEKQGLRIRSLVANLNTLSKLDFGLGDYQKEPVKICGFIRKTAADFLNRDAGGRYRFEVEIEDGLQELTVSANADLFQRMLENLIHNSMRHNPEGCRIVMRLGRVRGARQFFLRGADSARQRFCLRDSDGARHRCCFQIEDDGAGASEETLRTLNRRGYVGAGKLGEHGIGLRLVRQIAKFHSWKVSFSNCEPHGFLCKIIL